MKTQIGPLSLAAVLAACSSGSPNGSTTTAGTSAASTTSASTSSGTTSSGSTSGSSTGTGTTSGSTTGTSTSSSSSGSTTGTTGTTSSGTTTGSPWTEIGAVPDPGAADALYTQFIAPLPLPGGGQEMVFGSGGRTIYQSTNEGGTLSTPAAVFDAGGGIYLETLTTSSYQGGTANAVAWVASGNGVFLGAMTQVDGGDWNGLDLSSLPTPLTTSVAYDQATGTPWLVATTYNQTHLYVAPMDGTGTTYVPVNPDSGVQFPATWVAATSCSISDGGSAICFAFVSGSTQHELWGATFVPATQQTQATLFEVADSNASPFTGVAIANLGNGDLAVVAAAESSSSTDYTWASYGSIDTAPALTTTGITGGNGDPGVFAWHNAPVLFYIDQSNFPYVEKALALSGAPAPAFPPDAGTTKYPLGYSDDAGAIYFGLASTALSEVQLLKLP
jgi:hypothetical protein